MFKFKYKPSHGEPSITYQVEVTNLEDLLYTFNRFAKACGFRYDGEIGVLEDEIEIVAPTATAIMYEEEGE